MAKRESDTDIRKFLPDLPSILKRADPAYGEKIYREAMDNPELDEAIAERDRAIAEMEGREGTNESVPPEMEAREATGESVPPDDEITAPHVVGTRVSAPSPWATAAPNAIDRSALPSATAPSAEVPGAAPPVTSPVQPRGAAQAQLSGRRKLPRWVFPGILAIALAPLAMWAVMSTLPPRHPLNPAPGASASAQVAVPATVDGGTVPGIQSSAPLESVALPSATVLPTAPTAPNTAPRVPPVPIKRHPELNSRADAGASPPMTTEPVTPAASAKPQVPPPKPEAID
jgi:hypothetical protein